MISLMLFQDVAPANLTDLKPYFRVFSPSGLVLNNALLFVKERVAWVEKSHYSVPEILLRRAGSFLCKYSEEG